MILEILTGSLGYFYRLTVHKQLKYELLIGIKEVRRFFKTLKVIKQTYKI